MFQTWPFRYLNSFFSLKLWLVKNKWISNLYLSWSSYHGNVPPNMEMTISHRLSMKRLPILKPRPEVCYSFITKIRNSPRDMKTGQSLYQTLRLDEINNFCSEIFRSDAYIKSYRPKSSKLVKFPTLDQYVRKTQMVPNFIAYYYSPFH